MTIINYLKTDVLIKNWKNKYKKMKEPLESLNLRAHLSTDHRNSGITEDPFGSFKPSKYINI